MARILVVEDDAETRLLIAHALKHAGHSAIAASSGRSGVDFARSAEPELLILDVGLPDVSGMEVALLLRADAATCHIPIIFVTARCDEADRIAGLEMGAEDYVSKPFSVRELVLRANNVLRRNGAEHPQPAQHTFTCGPILLELNDHKVMVGGESISLTPTEFRLLRILTSRADRVQSREVLLADVWGMVPDLETRTVDAHVKRLRDKLGAAGELLETVRGIGYRFKSQARAG